MFWKNNKKETQEMMQELSDKFSAVKSEVEITLEVQSEYIDYHNKIDIDAYSEAYVIDESEKLFKDGTVESEKKRILFLLGHIATLPCVRIIEEFINKAEGELKQWAVLAFDEGWMFLENEAMGTNTGRIWSGAGGDGDNMRYFFSIRSKSKEPFSDEKKKIIQDGINKAGAELGSVIEVIEFKDDILLASVLIPMEVAVGNMIEKAIRACNAKSKILNSHYYVTNLRKPDWEKVKNNTPK